MKRQLSLAVLTGTLIFSGAGCSTTRTPSMPTANAPTSVSPIETLSRIQMEALYDDVIASIDLPSPDTYLSLVDTRRYSADELAALKRGWNDATRKDGLKRYSFDAYSTRSFAGIKQEGQTAGYYYTSLATDRLILNVFSFHHAQDGWKLSPVIGELTVDYPVNAQGVVQLPAEAQMQKDVQDLIANDRIFAFEPEAGAPTDIQKQENDASSPITEATVLFQDLSEGRVDDVYDRHTSPEFKTELSRAQLTRMSRQAATRDFVSFDLNLEDKTAFVDPATGGPSHMQYVLKGKLVTSTGTRHGALVVIQRMSADDTWQLRHIAIDETPS